MENKINIAEILKDCQQGMELDCTNYNGVVTFEKITDNSTYPVYIKVECDNEYFSHTLTKYGQTCKTSYNKCIIFPKGKTNWEGFQRPFKDGDVVTYRLRGSLVAFIYKERTSTMLVKTHFALYAQNMGFCVDGDIALKEEEIVFATEEEKQKLFDAIKANGYKWNPETKTLEKLVIPKFNVGDKIQRISPDYRPIRVIKSLEVDRYRLDNGNYVKFSDEGAYKLLNFDITTLKAFDKVLVRYNSLEKWHIQFFEKYNTESSTKYPFICLCNNKYCQCIPYNDETKHLLDTTNDCDEYYKTWK